MVARLQQNDFHTHAIVYCRVCFAGRKVCTLITCFKIGPSEAMGDVVLHRGEAEAGAG